MSQRTSSAVSSLPDRKAKSLPYAPRTYQKWTSEEEDHVVEMRRNGASLLMIAQETGRSVAAISGVLRRRSIRWMNDDDE